MATTAVQIDTVVELERGNTASSSSTPGNNPSPTRQASKYQQLATHHALSDHRKDGSPDLRWSNIRFSSGSKTILDNCFGYVPSQQVCAIMGPSGSGKSSLLNVLAGRSSTVDNIKVDGHVVVAGKAINPVAFRKNIAYVMQEDTLMATATPREAIKFSAAMRLPAEISSQVIDDLTEALLEDLGILECGDVMIGGAMIKGISGGQRKRTSVGVELVTSPALLFLDEPTSGLDSTSATSLVHMLKQMAATDTTVVLTIHQPSSQIFFLFDQVMFMKSGRVFFAGRPEEITMHYNKLGFKCPLNYNPSDFLMNIVQTHTVEDAEAKGLYIAPPSDSALVSSDAGGGDKGGGTIQSFIADNSTSLVSNHSFSRQLVALTYREALNTKRDIAALIGRFGVTIFLNFLFGLIFLGAAGGDNSDNEDRTNHFGAITMVIISGMFGSAQPTMLSFPFERPMFLREYTTGTYGAVPYFLAKLFMEVPLSLLQTLVQFILVYFMLDMQGDFWIIVVGVYGLAMASSSVAVALGCAVNDVKDATEMAPLLFVPQMLFVGFFVTTDQIPIFLRWCQYLCGLKYGMNIVLLTEFDSRLDSCSGKASAACASLLENNDVNINDWWFYMIMLIVLFIAGRLLGGLILVRKAKRFY